MHDIPAENASGSQQPVRGLPAEQPKSDKSYPTSASGGNDLQTALREVAEMREHGDADDVIQAQARLARLEHQCQRCAELEIENANLLRVLREEIDPPTFMGEPVVSRKRPDVAAMVNRFLGWPLPKTFGPDCGISFKPLAHPNGWPIGTNLFTAEEARAMFEHVLALPPGESAGEVPSNKNAPESSSAAPVEAVEVRESRLRTAIADYGRAVWGDGWKSDHLRQGTVKLRLDQAIAAFVAQPPQAVQEDERDVLLRVIQRLNGNPYNLTKSECIAEVQAMRAATTKETPNV